MFAGDYEVSVKFNDQHIPDSPYLVPVCAPPRDARRLTVTSLQVRHEETSPHWDMSTAIKEQGSNLSRWHCIWDTGKKRQNEDKIQGLTHSTRLQIILGGSYDSEYVGRNTTGNGLRSHAVQIRLALKFVWQEVEMFRSQCL